MNHKVFCIVTVLFLAISNADTVQAAGTFGWDKGIQTAVGAWDQYGQPGSTDHSPAAEVPKVIGWKDTVNAPTYHGIQTASTAVVTDGNTSYPDIDISPPGINATLYKGLSGNRTLTVGNIGLAPLNFSILPLLRIITDPAGDGSSSVEIIQVYAASSSTEVTIKVVFNNPMDRNNTVGYISLDTDQNRSTGIPPSSGSTGQDIGADYEANLSNMSSEGIAVIYRTDTYATVAEVPVSFGSDYFMFSIPLSVLSNDDGNMDITMALGDSGGPIDWAPNAGHGTIRNTEWLSADPTSGTVPEGNSMNVTVTLKAENLAADMHFADIAIKSNDPDEGMVFVPVALNVIEDILASPTEINTTLYKGLMEYRTLTIENAGYAPYNFTVAPLSLVLTDPAGDGNGSVDITKVYGASNSTDVTIKVVFNHTLDRYNTTGYISLDTDQNRSTGTPPTSGSPGQDIGADYEVSLFRMSSKGVADIYRTGTHTKVAEAPISFGSDFFMFSVPLSVLSNDDGNMDITMALGNLTDPTDWAPDAGHGTIKVLNWLTAAPSEGSVPAGGQTNVTVTLDASNIEAGVYSAYISVKSKDSGGTVVDIPVNLYVVDTTVPVVTIISPQNNTPYTTKSVPLTFTVNEPTSWMGYSLDGGANVTLTGNTTLDNLTAGLHDLRLWATDLTGNTGFSEAWFTITTIRNVAVMDIEAPNNTIKGTTININVTVNNKGTETETFDVILNDTTDNAGLGIQSVTLAPGETAVKSFAWNTTDAAIGYHTLNAAASPVPDESELLDNNKTALIQILPPPDSPPVANAGPDRMVYTGDTIFLDGRGSTDDHGIVLYEWDFESDGIYDATGVNVSHAYNTAGNYTATLRVTDTANQTSTDTAIIIVRQRDLPPVANAGPDQAVYAGDTVYFSGSNSTDDSGIVLYEWDFTSDGTYDATGVTASHIYSMAGNYTVTLRVTDTVNQTSTDTSVVTVNELPVYNGSIPSLTTDKANYLKGQTVNATAVVINTGNRALDAQVKFTYIRPDLSTAYTETIPVSVQVNGSANAMSSYKLPSKGTQLGTWTVKAELVYSGQILDTRTTTFQTVNRL